MGICDKGYSREKEKLCNCIRVLKSKNIIAKKYFYQKSKGKKHMESPVPDFVY